VTIQQYRHVAAVVDTGRLGCDCDSSPIQLVVRDRITKHTHSFLIIMAALRSGCGDSIFSAVVTIFFLLFSSPTLSGRRLDVYHTSTRDVALVVRI